MCKWKLVCCAWITGSFQWVFPKDCSSDHLHQRLQSLERCSKITYFENKGSKWFGDIETHGYRCHCLELLKWGKAASFSVLCTPLRNITKGGGEGQLRGYPPSSESAGPSAWCRQCSWFLILTDPTSPKFCADNSFAFSLCFIFWSHIKLQPSLSSAISVKSQHLSHSPLCLPTVT